MPHISLGYFTTWHLKEMVARKAMYLFFKGCNKKRLAQEEASNSRNLFSHLSGVCKYRMKELTPLIPLEPLGESMPHASSGFWWTAATLSVLCFIGQHNNSQNNIYPKFLWKYLSYFNFPITHTHTTHTLSHYEALRFQQLAGCMIHVGKYRYLKFLYFAIIQKSSTLSSIWPRKTDWNFAPWFCHKEFSGI